jgi:hypothetical protein
VILRKKSKPLIFTIVDPLFKTEPVFILGCSAEKAEDFLKKECRARVEIARGAGGMMITRDKYPERIVWSAYRPDSPAGTAVLLHELFHLVLRICSDKGVPVVSHHENGECGDEAAAYLFEFFSRECLRRKRRPKTKSRAQAA